MVRLAMVPRSPLRLMFPSRFSNARSLLLPTPARRWGGRVTFSLLFSGAVACGHPASEAECQTIVERIVDLELPSPKSDRSERDRQTAQREPRRGRRRAFQMLVGCIGKHVTDKAMACVRAAGTAAEITDRRLQ